MFAIAIALAAMQQPDAALATHWKHKLIRHERSDDFDGGGQGARIDAPAPLELNANLVAPWSDAPYNPGPGGRVPEKHVAACYQSRVIDAVRFDEALISWNVDCPANASFSVDLRVGHATDDSWSPWLEVAPMNGAAASAVTEFAGGKIDVDYFKSEQRWDRIQYMLRADSEGRPADEVLTVRVRRVVLCLSRRTDDAPAASRVPKAHARIAVPFRSQRAEKAEIAGKICSPTSVSMVMAYRGVDVPTADVAARVFDVTHEIYGNWPLNVQGAYTFGVPGYLARFSKWSEVEALIAAGQPLVISIAVKEGELDGAPYKSTDGHLLVVCGFDENGDVLVNDPAAADAEHGQVTYRRGQLERVWMDRGGTSYVLLPPDRAK